MPLVSGQVLRERYQIEGLIGQGGMGAVYDARDSSLHIRCAIKENLVFTESAQRQFEHEARLLASLRHSNLPRVTDHFVIPNQGQYLVMDFIEGEDLKARLERLGPLPEADVVRWALDILNALAYLHRRSIIHRDIKPANIKITPDGEPVLVDFGIAKEQASGSGMTVTGTRGFTVGFTSPEQYGVGSGGTDNRSDLYSFGATLYNLLSGEPPTDALTRIIKPDAYAPLAQRAPQVSPALQQALDCALALDPDARFASAEAMRAAVQGEHVESAWAPAAPAPVAAPAPAPAPEPEPPPAPDTILLEQPVHLELLRVPAGEFLMGSDPGQDEEARHEELPQHSVYVSEFYIGKHPVTNAQYAAFVYAARWRPPDHWQGGQIPFAKDNHPVVLVLWEDAVAFCEWLSRETGMAFRLPTEAEWEKAARGTDGRIFPWGDEWSERRLNNSQRRGETTAIGRYSPRGNSPCGATDMLGNVWEWCADGYNPSEYAQREAGVRDPQGPPGPQAARVMKGGTWLSTQRLPRCAQRSKCPMEIRYDFLGFRVAMSSRPGGA